MVLPNLIRNQFQHVILYVTDCCNLSCRTCFVRKGNHFLAPDKARIMADKLGPIRWLDIGGGEPFLHRELPEICRIFRPRSVTIPTNGQDTERVLALVQRIREVVKDVTIALSLDGFEEQNDFIRGAGSYKRALDTFQRLRDEGKVVLKVNTVVTSFNLPSLVDFVRYVRGLNPDYHSLLLIRGRPAADDMRLPDLALLESVTPQILEVLGTYTYGHKYNTLLGGLKRRYQRHLWNVSIETLKRQECLVPCRAPWVHRVVYPTGDVAMCELMPAAGNIFVDSMEVLQERFIKQLGAVGKGSGACFCTHNCNMGENIMLHPASVLRVLLGREK